VEQKGLVLLKFATSQLKNKRTEEFDEEENHFFFEKKSNSPIIHDD